MATVTVADHIQITLRLITSLIVCLAFTVTRMKGSKSLKMEGDCCSETQASTYKFTRRHDPEDQHRNKHLPQKSGATWELF
jgi:hypothetical protein